VRKSPGRSLLMGGKSLFLGRSLVTLETLTEFIMCILILTIKEKKIKLWKRKLNANFQFVFRGFDPWTTSSIWAIFYSTKVFGFFEGLLFIFPTIIE